VSKPNKYTPKTNSGDTTPPKKTQPTVSKAWQHGYGPGFRPEEAK